MKTLICSRPGQFDFVSKEEPQLTNGHAIIKIKRIGICGTDLHAFEGTQPFFEYPRVLGHELAGELVASDDGSGIEIGEPVTIIPYFNCGHCIACRTGKPNCCSSISVCGVHEDGGMAQYLSVPSYSLFHCGGLSYDQLALIEPLAIGTHGVERASIRAGENVLIIGAGPIGLATIGFARIAGGNVIVMDVNENRLEFCKDKLKVPHTINALSADVIAQLRSLTNGEMPSVVIDCTGNLKAINGGFQYLSHGGRYLLIGLQKEEVCFSHPEFHKREATLMSSRNATRADFEKVSAALKRKQIDPATFITHRIHFKKLKDEFEKWLDPANHVIKAMVEME